MAIDFEELSPYEKTVAVGNGIGQGVISPENMPIMHRRLLENIQYFDKFCKKHDLKYCLIWGSCIGAVREHGIIPWDDDMDVAMPRADYEKLFSLWDEYGDKEKFSLYRTTEDFCAKFPIGILRNNNTTIIYDFCKNQDVVQGVKLDIEPWDEVPDSKWERNIQKFFFLLFEVYSTQRLPNTTIRLKRFRTIKRLIVKILLSIVSDEKKRCRLAYKALKHATKYNGRGTELVRCNCSIEIKAKDLFETEDCEFDGIVLKIPKGYDSILRVYGNYMEKPPVEKRVPGIEYVYYDLNSSCYKYKGIYYCKNETGGETNNGKE